MEQVMKGIGIGVVTLVLVALLSVVGGTIVYWIWPTAMEAFPGLVENGTLPPELRWWAAVCLTWLFGILIKSTSTTSS
jgi:hypothetical protein